MIKKYPNIETYRAAGVPTAESRIAVIEDSGEVKVDGVNIVTDNPVCGDACYHDGTKVVFLKGGDWLNPATLPSNYVKVGEVFAQIGDFAAVIKGTTEPNQKYLPCVQHAITAISSTSIKLNLVMTGSTTAISVPITLTSTSISAATAEEISEALDKAGNAGNTGYDVHKWWAWYDEENSRIVVQCDDAFAYQQFNGIGGTGTNITTAYIQDMPFSSIYWKTSGARRSGGGIMNQERGFIYYSVSGDTPTAAVSLTATGNPVNLTAYNTSEYCSLLRDTYGTGEKGYRKYLKHNQSVAYPQKYGAFALPDGKYMTDTFGDWTYTMKDGTVAWKYPALHACKHIKFEGIEGIDEGDWFLPGVREGSILVRDETLAALAPTARKMGNTVITNSSYRWFSQRSNSSGAWLFYGTYGYLHHIGVYGSLLVQGVVLLRIRH